jgi:hypothetical protein
MGQMLRLTADRSKKTTEPFHKALRTFEERVVKLALTASPL